MTNQLPVGQHVVELTNIATSLTDHHEVVTFGGVTFLTRLPWEVSFLVLREKPFFMMENEYYRRDHQISRVLKVCDAIGEGWYNRPIGRFRHLANELPGKQTHAARLTVTEKSVAGSTRTFLHNEFSPMPHLVEGEKVVLL